MTSLPPLLAELGSVEKTVISVLSVAGGFLVGYVATHLLARGLCRFVFKSNPIRLLRFTRLAGGVGGAILVYFLLSGEGGLGLGGGGGAGLLSGDNRKNEEKNAPQSEPQKNELKVGEKLDTSREEQFVVFILKSDSPDRKFYRFDQETTACSLDDVLTKIDNRAKAGKKLVVRIREGDADYAYQAETLLERRLQERGIVFTGIPTGIGNTEKK
jgi:hypothetical protein